VSKSLRGHPSDQQGIEMKKLETEIETLTGNENRVDSSDACLQDADSSDAFLPTSPADEHPVTTDMAKGAVKDCYSGPSPLEHPIAEPQVSMQDEAPSTTVRQHPANTDVAVEYPANPDVAKGAGKEDYSGLWRNSPFGSFRKLPADEHPANTVTAKGARKDGYSGPSPLEPPIAEPRVSMQDEALSTTVRQHPANTDVAVEYPANPGAATGAGKDDYSGLSSMEAPNENKADSNNTSNMWQNLSLGFFPTSSAFEHPAKY
jgi:hypothetical protein